MPTTATTLAHHLRTAAITYLRQHPDIPPTELVTAARILEVDFRRIAGNPIQTPPNHKPPTNRTKSKAQPKR